MLSPELIPALLLGYLRISSYYNPERGKYDTKASEYLHDFQFVNAVFGSK
jgi:hypothetical protein